MKISSRDLVSGNGNNVSQGLNSMLRTTASQNPNQDGSGFNMFTMSELFLMNKPLIPNQKDSLNVINELMGALTGLFTRDLDEEDEDILNLVPRDIIGRMGDKIGAFTSSGGSGSGGGGGGGGSWGGSPPIGQATSAGELIIKSAEKYLLTPYVWGGKTPDGLDCSGLTWIAFHDLGVTIPHGSANQARAGSAISSMADAIPGDMLFWNRPNVNHIGFYAGDGLFLHAPQTGDVVRYDADYLPNNRAPSSIRRVQIPDSILQEHGVHNNSSQMENEAV